jgi:tetratricopeptide (TPR) repeat protein
MNNFSYNDSLHVALPGERSPTVPERVAESLFQTALGHQQTGRPDKAMDCYRQAVRIDPDFAEAIYNLGVLYYQQSMWGPAIECFRRVVELKPGSTDSEFNLAMALQQSGRYELAAGVFDHLLDTTGESPNLLKALGLCRYHEGRYEQAIQVLSRALAFNAEDSNCLNTIGLCWHRLGKTALAEALLLKAVDCQPENLRAYHNLGNLYLDLNRPTETLKWYRLALDKNPDDAAAQCEMGKLYLKFLYLTEACAHFRNALHLNPDLSEASLSLATTTLLAGDFTHGWRYYMKRFSHGTALNQDRYYSSRWPLWQGETFIGKTLIVHCEQGFGDSIQFARFLPEVKKRGGRVIFHVQEALLPLFESFAGIDEIDTLSRRPWESLTADLYVPLLNVAACLGVTLESIPAQTPYLHAGEPEKTRWRQRLASDKPRVGIVWAGNPNHVNNRNRSIPMEALARLSDHPGIQLYSLQKDIPIHDVRMLKDRYGILSLGNDFDDFGDTAAALACLDLIITVDTAIAHLAGAMARPVWVLLPFLPDWRWMLHRTDSPWYPTMRLFRQPQAGDWEQVLNNLKDELRTRY